jgi:hypothetical protein
MEEIKRIITLTGRGGLHVSDVKGPTVYTIGSQMAVRQSASRTGHTLLHINILFASVPHLLEPE